jgi:ferredoxin
MGKAIRIRIDRDRCVGAAMCVAVAPGSFAIDPDGKAVTTLHLADEAGRARQAAEECPAGAVILEDPETNEQIFP